MYLLRKIIFAAFMTMFLFMAGCSDNSTGLPPAELPLRIAYAPDQISTNIDSLFVCNDKGEQRQFMSTVKGIQSIHWPPEGEKIYFQENHISPSASVVYSIPEIGGEKEEVYTTSGLFTMETVSRDGKVIILRMREVGSEILELFRLDTKLGSVKKVSNGQTEDALPAISANVTMMAYAGSLPEQSYSNVYLFNLYSGSRTQVTDFQNAHIKSITISPANSYVYFSAQQESDSLYNNYLMRYAISTQKTDTLYQYSASSAGDYIAGLTWADNKTQLSFTAGNVAQENAHIFIMDLSGSNRRQISSAPAAYHIRGFDGIYVYFSYDTPDDNAVYRMDAGSGEITTLIDCSDCDRLVWNFNSLYK